MFSNYDQQTILDEELLFLPKAPILGFDAGTGLSRPDRHQEETGHKEVPRMRTAPPCSASAPRCFNVLASIMVKQVKHRPFI